MAIVLSHMTALEVIRRWDAPAIIERGRLSRPPDAPQAMPSLRELTEIETRTSALDGLEKPLHLIVSTEGGRHLSKGAIAHLCSCRLTDRSCFSLTPDVLCSMPELVALQMAEYASELELLLLLDELCGYYGIQPASKSGLVKRRDPLTTPERIEALLAELGPVRGSIKLRRALARCRVRSGSPMESRMAHLLEMPCSAGGFGMEVVSLNEPMLVERMRGLLSGCSRRVREPDILVLAPEGRGTENMPFRSVGFDYQGAYHRDSLQECRDIDRRNELLGCGTKDYEIDALHFGDLEYLEGIVSKARRDLGIVEAGMSDLQRSALMARRRRLHAALEAADGLSWTGRKVPVYMRGSRKRRGEDGRESLA